MIAPTGSVLNLLNLLSWKPYGGTPAEAEVLYGHVLFFAATVFVLLFCRVAQWKHLAICRFETVALIYLTFTIFMNICLNRYRASRLFGGTGYELYPEHQENVCDSTPLLVAVLVISALHLFFDIRTSRTWVCPVVGVGMYGAMSTGNLCPEGSATAALNTFWLATLGYREG